ncbi:MAG: pyridoxal phosphate-dependent aminotransferase [Synergistaceae bacterium]
MFSEKMTSLGSNRSVIREIAEYGWKRATEIGRENVFDFSIGNPNVPAPEIVKETIIELLNSTDSMTLHGYSSAPGMLCVRKTIAESINRRFGTNLTLNNIYMTSGAASSLTISIKALTEDDDEFVTFAPYFPEYTTFVESAGAKLKVLPPDTVNFQIDLDILEKSLTPQTKGIIINSPNNPSGVVYSEETIKSFCVLVAKKEKEFGHPIFIISDEPYRELVYGNVKVPYLMNYHKNVIVCYSYSKSLSLPGERIGYIATSPEAEQSQTLFAAICGAGRALGYVCAPTLFQQVVEKCVEATADISIYERNREILYNGLLEMGYEGPKPDGAFYLFVKSLEEDANAFCEKAKKYELLLVPGDGFGCPGYVRIAYCVTTKQIEKSLPAFAKLAKEYKK